MIANQLGYRNEAIKNGLQDKRFEIYPADAKALQ